MSEALKDIDLLDGFSPVKKEDLEMGILLDDLYFISLKRNYQSRILRAGSFVSFDFAQKYLNQNIFVKREFKEKTFKYICESFNVWKEAKNEKDRIDGKNQFLKIVNDIFLKDNESLIYLCYLLYKECYYFKNEELLDHSEESFLLTQRSLFVASFVFLTATLDGITDFDTLEDLFNVAFHLDVGLIKDRGISWYLLQACEQERTKLNGVEYLKGAACKEELIDFFKEHPQKSYDFLLTKKEKFHYPGVLKFALYQHERRAGGGFPLGINYSVLTNFEKYISYVDRLIPYEIVNFEDVDMSSFFKGQEELSSFRFLWQRFFRSHE